MGKCVLIGIYDTVNLEILNIHRETFGLPVVAFTTLEYPVVECGLTKEELAKHGVLYSLHEFYYEKQRVFDSMTQDEMDKLQRAVEDKLGIENNSTLMSYDKAYFKFHDFHSARRYQLLTLLFAAKLLSENDPIGFFNSRGTYLFNVIADACLRKGIPSFHTRIDAFTMTRLQVCDSKGQLLGMKEAYEKLRIGDTSGLSPVDLYAADAHLNGFQKSQKRAQVVDNCSRSLSKAAHSALKTGAKSIARNIRLWNSCQADRNNGELDSPWQTLPRWPVKAARMFAVERTNIVTHNPDMSTKFIYVPLHLQLETTNLYFGEKYSHHEGFIFQLAKRVPSEYVLYVKDHTSMVGLRPLSFYKKIASLPNVVVIDPNVSTFRLIKNSAAVITVVSTAGWEAHLLGKPVITLGDVYYDFLQGILKVNIYDEHCERDIRKYIETYTPNENSIRAAMRALYASTHVIGGEYDGVDDTSPGVARREAMITKILYDKWSQYILRTEKLSCFYPKS